LDRWYRRGLTTDVSRETVDGTAGGFNRQRKPDAGRNAEHEDTLST